MSHIDPPTCKFTILIYMSIRQYIGYQLKSGQLFQIFPRLMGAPVQRVLLANADVNRLVTGPWQNPREEIRCGRLWADFDRYVEGRLISVALDAPYTKPRTTYLARLDPERDDVFEIRSRDPRPGMRIFGRFADRDVFIATNWQYREDLGGPHDRLFARERTSCLAEWRKLLPTYDSVKGTSINDYFNDVTNILSV